jgi:hypothetical protein
VVTGQSRKVLDSTMHDSKIQLSGGSPVRISLPDKPSALDEAMAMSTYPAPDSQPEALAAYAALVQRVKKALDRYHQTELKGDAPRLLQVGTTWRNPTDVIRVNVRLSYVKEQKIASLTLTIVRTHPANRVLKPLN